MPLYAPIMIPEQENKNNRLIPDTGTNSAAKSMVTPVKRPSSSSSALANHVTTANAGTNAVSQTSSTLVAPTAGFSTPKPQSAPHASILRPKTAQTCTKADRTPFSPMSTCSSMTSCSSIGSDAREAARIAKLQSTQERIEKVQKLKEKWANEKERKAQLQKEKRKMDLKKLASDNAVAAEQRRIALEKQREIEQKEKEEKHEMLASSLLARSQLAADLEKQAKAKRRISMFLNSKMRKLAAEKEAKLQAEKKQQEVELLSSRRLDFLETREAKRQEEERRRESMHARTLYSAEQRQREEALEQLRKEEEHSLLELRAANWKDDQAAKQELDRIRRESMALRGDIWRAQKQREAEIEHDEFEQNLSFLQSKALDWKDVQAYKQKEERSRRESLAGRLEKWRAEKAQSEKELTDTKLAEEFERELEDQARKDVQEYRKKMEELRRTSLAYRLDKAKKDKDFDMGQQALQEMVNEELRRIEELDRQDVRQYKEKIQEARRQSLQYRLLTERQERMRLEGEHQAQLVQDAEDFQLRTLAWQDVKHYREQQQKQARQSLAWRLADAHRKKELEFAEHEDKMQKIHLDMLCKREDWLAVNDYKAKEQELRRKSIQLRLDNWRSQKLATMKEKEREELLREEDAMYREMDREALLTMSIEQASTERQNLSRSMVF